ncbi:pimeloyl-ACP methyl esterase BioG family protein [Cochlodiniinecator piscidefendens]|uniref:pimeloyl-ACP methyl esterase BioG family protein n=1 Tax=Cochlodiniinecator piscidefendens TaxID=2715756 RepID=UPI00140ABFBE|nr:pimeloyl-ACP methyl esterase BioG family protein [Cochlodiniinecator piscidefendens]
MNKHWLTRQSSDKLTLVFGGWGLGPAPFLGLAGDQDVLVVDNYTCIEDPLTETKDYQSVRLLAFSYGVASAAHWLSRFGLKPDRSVAVNGTLYPVDKRKGIAPNVFTATVEGLSDESFALFCRRAGHPDLPPVIDVLAAQAELRAIAARGPASTFAFDRVWISDRDRIVPASAQIAAWETHLNAVRHISAPHQPFRAGQAWQEWFD